MIAASGCRPAPEISGPLRVIADSLFPQPLRWSCPGGYGDLVGCKSERGDTTYFYYAHPEGVAAMLGVSLFGSDTVVSERFARRLFQLRMRLGDPQDCSRQSRGVRVEIRRWRLDEYDRFLVANLPRAE